MDTAKSDLTTVCQVCHHEATLREMLKSREVKPGLKEVGAECPKCKTFVHSYFVTDTLEWRIGELKSRAEMVRLHRTRHLLDTYKSMQLSFQREFDELNKKMREKYKVENGKVSVPSWEKEPVG